MVELAYRDEIGPKRKAVRILGQIADKANLLGDAAKKKSVEDEKTKLNEAIKSFCNDALAFLAALPEVETEKGLRQAVTIQQAHRLKMRADYNRYLAELAAN